MLLVVTIRCARCGAVGEVHVAGGWDIEKVDHDCSGYSMIPGPRKIEKADITDRRPFGRINVHFNPPRSVF